MRQYRVGIERLSDVRYKGENYMIYNTYWTTVNAESERQAKMLAEHNLTVKIAQNEIFTFGRVQEWKNIRIDLCEMVIGE